MCKQLQFPKINTGYIFMIVFLGSRLQAEEDLRIFCKNAKQSNSRGSNGFPMTMFPFLTSSHLTNGQLD